MDHVLHISLAAPSKIWDSDGAIHPSYHIHCIIFLFLPQLSPLFCLGLVNMLIFVICLCFFIYWSKAVAEVPIPVPLDDTKALKRWAVINHRVEVEAYVCQTMGISKCQEPTYWLENTSPFSSLNPLNTTIRISPFFHIS